MLDEMKRELSFHPEIHFVMKDANGNSETQIKQIRELVDEKVDLLVVSPNQAQPITPIVNDIYASGMPIIILDRKTLSDNYTAYVGANNYQVGLNAGTFANAILKGKGNLVEIEGDPMGSSAAIGRHNGFNDYISHYPEIKNVAQFNVYQSKSAWQQSLMDYLKANNNIQLIFAPNDRLAYAAALVCKKLGIEKNISIIGVDGLPGENGGIDLVDKGIFKATILYQTGGAEAILTAVNILEKKPYKKENELLTTIIDSTNVRIMKLQYQKVLAQQKDIDRSQQKIEDLGIIARNQTNIIYTISVSLALALILGSILFYYFKENKKINQRLALQNEEILNQRNQLIELGKKAQEATEAKINFFTNISHEFRTPLTLIITPLEELLGNSKISISSKQYLTLIQKNVMRLFKLINQLIDFRKVELFKMKLQASENDLVAFTNDIVETFKTMAKKKHIDLQMFTKERNIPLWFDTSMLDKVMFNLLSNAFKFTNENGFIYINLEKDLTENKVKIKIEDNGIGMKPDMVQHAFELFYQGDTTNKKGSGLGLALSKELLALHHGQITVSSKLGKGTAFEIVLPLGTAHLQPDEMVATKNEDKIVWHEERMQLMESNNESAEPIFEMDKTTNHEYSILVVEDNTDLINFLAATLGKEYEVLVADNGNSALQQAFDNIPDLIISDIVLPGKDGISITNTLKNDFRTSHIPIILLTAKTAIEERIEGMKNMADAYIVKPFNVKFLVETIKSLMKNRDILRSHYTSEISAETKLQSPKKLDRKFINEFTSIIENNISNENFSVDELAQKMGISRIQLYRKVKALLGYNINDYILNSRLQKAKHYLHEGGLSISEIAYKVGFGSSAYFSTVFKTKCGMTPKEYKEK